MAKRQSPPSTEPGLGDDTFPSAVVFDELAAELAPFFAPRLGVDAKPAVVRSALADPARIDARLAAVPPAALGVLEHLVDMGGQVFNTCLTEIASARHGLDAPATRMAIAHLIDAGLVVPLTRYGDLGSTALIDVSAAAIARRVRGLSVPEVPEPASFVATPDVTLRDRIALIASVAHVPQRITQHLDTNRSSAKKLAALVGWEPEDVVAELDRAIRGGILGAKDKVVVPVVERLLELARGERPLDELDAEGARLAEWVGPRWIAREALVRALVMSRIAERAHTVQGAVFAGGTADFADADARVERADLREAEVGGHRFVRAPDRRERSGHGDGHVTPSFEVMLGPAADPELVATIALATEPGRFDLVLTRRITPRSIQAAIALGLTVGAILDALGKVGRHGVPDNVRAMVEDWAKAARIVRVSKVWALEASSPEAADAAARALGPRVLSRPSPTVVLVLGDGPDPTSALASAGLPVDAPARALRHTKPALSPLPAHPPMSLTASPDPKLRARFAAGRGEGFMQADLQERRIFVPWRALDALVDTLRGDDAARVEDFTQLFVRLWEAGEALFMAWLEGTSVKETLDHVEASPLAIVPWLVLTPRDRRRTLEAADSLLELVVLTEGMGRAPRTTDGMQAERLLRDPRLRALLAPLELGARPSSAPSEAMDPDAIREGFLEAASVGAVVTLRIRGPGGEREVAFIPERIHERGRDVALLGIDPESEEGLAFPLAQVIALTPM